MRRFFVYLKRLVIEAFRRVSDGAVARAMLLQARNPKRYGEPRPFVYLDWVVTLAHSDGCLILVAGRRSMTAKLEDMASLLGALVRVSDSKDPALPPFQVVSRTGRFVAWGWRPDGFDLSAREQTLILSAVLGPRERRESWGLN